LVWLAVDGDHFIIDLFLDGPPEFLGKPLVEVPLQDGSQLLDLERKAHVRVEPSLLEQVVMDLLHVRERQIILRELALVDDHLDRSVELDASPERFLVPLEDLVHDDLKLVDPLFLTELHIVRDLLRKIHHKGINLLVATLDSDLLRRNPVPVDVWLELLNEDSLLWERFLFTDGVLAK